MNKHRHYFVAVVTHVQTLLSPGSAGAGVLKLLLGQGTEGNPGGNSECAAQPSHGRGGRRGSWACLSHACPAAPVLRSHRLA